jgi:hypothetical protein
MHIVWETDITNNTLECSVFIINFKINLLAEGMEDAK